MVAVQELARKVQQALPDVQRVYVLRLSGETVFKSDASAPDLSATEVSDFIGMFAGKHTALMTDGFVFQGVRYVVLDVDAYNQCNGATDKLAFAGFRSSTHACIFTFSKESISLFKAREAASAVYDTFIQAGL